MSAVRGGVHPLHLIAGPALWLLWFVIAYGGLSLGCALVPPDVGRGAWNGINAALVVIMLLTMAVMLLAARHCRRVGREAEDRASRFHAGVAVLAYAISALATLALGVPLLALPPCI